MGRRFSVLFCFFKFNFLGGFVTSAKNQWVSVPGGEWGGGGGGGGLGGKSLVYGHTDHVMGEQMDFIVHFDWMSFSDGVEPIYSLNSRHGKRQDKKHSHYPSRMGKPAPSQIWAGH